MLVLLTEDNSVKELPMILLTANRGKELLFLAKLKSQNQAITVPIKVDLARKILPISGPLSLETAMTVLPFPSH